MAGESATSPVPLREGSLPPTIHDEVWLRGNMRPVVGLALGSGVAIAAVGGVVLALGGAAWAAPVTAIGFGLFLPVFAVLAFMAARPRLRRRGVALEVRLSPARVERLPLEVVECVFPGSRPLPAAFSHATDRRVTTVILRLAERATAWSDRPTFPPWGTWEDGHIMIDGRWCEPLSSDRTRALANRLTAARQGRAGPCDGAADR